MDVKVFFLLFIFQVRVVVSKTCSCYVGHAKHNGDVDLKLEDCPPLSTMPPSIKTTSADPETSGPTQQKPDNTTQKPDTTAQEPANNTGTLNVTTNETTVATEIFLTTSAEPQNSTTEQDFSTSATSPAKKTSALTTAALQSSTKVQEQIPCCQISIMNQSQSEKLRFNATFGWIANFSCFNSPSENVFKCNNPRCNDLTFLKNPVLNDKQFKVPDHCINGTKTNEAINSEEFMWETTDGDRIEACNDYSRKKCSNLNVTQSPCSSQSDFCCCPLPDGYCSKIPSPNSSAVPAPPRPSKHGNQQHKSSNWKIVGFIGTAVVCFIFLAFVGRIIHGKKNNDELEIPNYKYSRLRADYVEPED